MDFTTALYVTEMDDSVHWCDEDSYSDLEQIFYDMEVGEQPPPASSFLNIGQDVNEGGARRYNSVQVGKNMILNEKCYYTAEYDHLSFKNSIANATAAGATINSNPTYVSTSSASNAHSVTDMIYYQSSFGDTPTRSSATTIRRNPDDIDSAYFSANSGIVHQHPQSTAQNKRKMPSTETSSSTIPSSAGKMAMKNMDNILKHQNDHLRDENERLEELVEYLKEQLREQTERSRDQLQEYTNQMREQANLVREANSRYDNSVQFLKNELENCRKENNKLRRALKRVRKACSNRKLSMEQVRLFVVRVVNKIL